MIATVNWQYVIMDVSAAVGWRAKRRQGGAPYPISASGAVTPMSNNWISGPAPAHISYNGRNFIFAFWSLSAQDAMTGQSSAQIQPFNVANDSHAGGVWTVSAKAFYAYDWTGGGGGNGGGGVVLIDAFDIQLGDFIPDDFVDVSPDQGGLLTIAANNGMIDTGTQIAQGTPETITARDSIPTRRFGYWFPLAALLKSGNPNTPPTVGTTDPHDIVAHHDDLVIAVAFYNEVHDIRFGPPRVPNNYNPWWWIETHGGLVPPGPPDPWLIELSVAVTLAQAAARVSPSLRVAVLEIAERQMAVASATIKNQIQGLQKEQTR
jgi:hypothetical protein